MKKAINVLSSTKISEFKDIFLQQRTSLLCPKDKDINSSSDEFVDEVDIAQNLVIKEMEEKLSLREKDIYFKINSALQRIEDGTFGLCEECEEPIAEGRLHAIPYSTTCISCAEQQESMIKQYRRS